MASVSTGQRRCAFEAPELLALVSTFEHDLAVPDGKPKPVRPAATRHGR